MLHFDGDLMEAVCRTLPLLKGTYGLAVVSPEEPGTIIGARLGSPLVLGVGAGEHFLASDPAALIGQTQQFPEGAHYDEFRIGGTSLSSPIFAGLMALADQAAADALTLTLR